MKTTSVSELKSRLSAFLADVQRGEVILVKDRNRPIARIVPLTLNGAYENEESALVAAGVMTLPESDVLPASFWRWKVAQIDEKEAVRVVRDERDED